MPRHLHASEGRKETEAPGRGQTRVEKKKALVQRMMRGFITRKFDKGPIPLLIMPSDFRLALKKATVEELEAVCKEYKL